MRFLMCEPEREYFNVENLKNHNITQSAQREVAIAQHRKLSSMIESFDHEVVKITELKDHPNSVFTKDPVSCTPYGYIKLRMGLESRRGEEDWIGETLESLDVKCIGEIKCPATVEGGDILFSNRVAFIGHSSRTNEEGISQLSKILNKFEYEIRVADVPSPYLHLGGMMTVLNRKKMLCVEEFFPDNFFDGFDLIKVPVNDFISGNVIFLEPDKIIAERSNVETIKILKDANFEVHEIALSEFVKGTGGPTCLICG